MTVMRGSSGATVCALAAFGSSRASAALAAATEPTIATSRSMKARRGSGLWVYSS